MPPAQKAAEELRPWVRARVVDLRTADVATEARYLVDTNVLYFVHYDRFSTLEELGEGPRRYQLEFYPKYLKRVRELGGALFVHRVGLIEFARTVERAELQILYAIKTPEVTDIPADLNIKAIRRAYRDEYRVRQERVLTYVGAVRKDYQPIPITIHKEPEEPAFWAEWDGKWYGTIADPEDIAQLVDTLAFGISAIISDDSDWVSIDGIRLFTANLVAIQAARLAGMLDR